MINESKYIADVGLKIKCGYRHSLKYKCSVDEKCTLDDCHDIHAQWNNMFINRRKQASLNKRVINKDRFKLPIKCTGIRR